MLLFNKLAAMVGYRNVMIFGIIAMAGGLILFLVFDHAVRTDGLFQDMYRLIDKYVGKYVTSAFMFIAGLLIFIYGYVNLRKAKDAENKA